MKKWLFLVLLITMILLSSLSQAGFSWGKVSHNKGHWGKVKNSFIKHLDLTEKQQAMLLEQKQKMETEMLALRQKNQKIRQKMRNELEKDSPNKNVLTAYIKEINENRTDMQIKRMDYILKIKSQLTPEQKKKFKSLFKDRKKGHKKK